MGLDLSRPRERKNLPTLLVSLTHMAKRAILVTYFGQSFRIEMHPTNRRAEKRFSKTTASLRCDQRQVGGLLPPGQRMRGRLCERSVNVGAVAVNILVIALWK